MAAGVVQHEGGGKAAGAGGHLQGIGVAELAGVALLRGKVRRRRALVLRITAASIEDAGAEDSARGGEGLADRSEEHTSELQSHLNLVCRLLLEKKKKRQKYAEC